MALFFQRDATLKVYPNDRDGVFNETNDKAFQIPLLEGFSFSQSTNSSEITLAEMESTTGDSRRGRKMFNDSLAPVEWSFSTYLRPYLAGNSGASWQDSKQHLVDEVLWNALLAKSRIGDVGTTKKRVDRINVTNAGSSYTSVPTVAVAAPAAQTVVQSNVSVTNNTFTDTDDVFLVGDKLTYSAAGGQAATPLVNGRAYFVVEVSATGGIFKLSATSGGAVLDITNDGNDSQTFTGETATAEAVVTQSATSATRQTVEAVNVVFGGSGYATAPTVSFSGGGGSSAAATAVLGQSEDAINTRGGDVNTPLVMDSSRSNKSALNTMILEFNMGSDVLYRLNKAVCNSATINFDVDGIATVEWSGMAATISSHGATKPANRTVT